MNIRLAPQLVGSASHVPGHARGLLLLECIVYLALFAVVVSLAFAAFYQTHQNGKQLARVSDDVVRSLHAGERWRADVRAATASPILRQTAANETVFEIPRAPHAIAYRQSNEVIFRIETNSTEWPLLSGVKTSRFIREARQHVTIWRWEVELQSKQKTIRVPPLFSFQAVESPRPRR